MNGIQLKMVNLNQRTLQMVLEKLSGGNVQREMTMNGLQPLMIEEQMVVLFVEGRK